MHEEAKKAEKPLPAEQQIALKLKLHQPTKQEYELLYIEVLYTIKHKIGTTIGGHLPYMQDLYQYAQDAFGMPPEDHAKLLAKATEEKRFVITIIIILNIIIIIVVVVVIIIVIVVLFIGIFIDFVVVVAIFIIIIIIIIIIIFSVVDSIINNAESLRPSYMNYVLST
uniref:FERM domain-containing protein n=1 Tax=Octopus bimaculoides TaxID=37653 RepID=A0A0L8HI43_OCTBM